MRSPNAYRPAGMLVLLILFLVPQPALTSTDAKAHVLRGNELYAADRPEEAAEAYETALALGLENGHVHYNLANAYYRAGRHGKAIAHYRLALTFLPGQRNVLANLSLARKQVGDPISAPPDAQTRDIALVPYSFLGRDRATKLFLSAYILFWLTFSLKPCSFSSKLRALKHACFTLAAVSGFYLLFVKTDRWGEPTLALLPESWGRKPAVVVAEEAPVRAAPTADSQSVFVLPEGAEVLTKTEHGDWLQVLLPGNRRGWAKTESLMTLQAEAA